MSDTTDHIIFRDGWNEEAVKRALKPGRIVFVEGLSSIFVLDEVGEVEELAADEHGKWDEAGTTHGRPQTPDEIDINDDYFLNSPVGRGRALRPHGLPLAHQRPGHIAEPTPLDLQLPAVDATMQRQGVRTLQPRRDLGRKMNLATGTVWPEPRSRTGLPSQK